MLPRGHSVETFHPFFSNLHKKVEKNVVFLCVFQLQTPSEITQLPLIATIKVEPSPNSTIKPGLCGEDNKGEDLVTLFSGKISINDTEQAFELPIIDSSDVNSSEKLVKFGDLNGVNA